MGQQSNLTKAPSTAPTTRRFLSGGDEPTNTGFPNIKTASRLRAEARTTVQKVFSVRVLLFVSFALPILLMGATSYASTTISIQKTTADLSHQISNSIVIRVQERVTSDFSYTWNFTETFRRALPDDLRYGLTPDPLNRMLWKLWEDSYNNVVTVYVALLDGSSDGYYRNTDESPDTFEIYCNMSTSLGWIGAVDDNGMVNRSDPTIYAPTDVLDLTAIAWWDQANATRTQIWSKVYFDDITLNGVIWYTCIYPLLDSNGDVLAFLAVDMTSGKLRDYLAEIYISPGAEVWLMEPGTGVLVASSDKREKTYVGVQTGITYAQDSNLDIVREISIYILNGTQTSETFDFTHTVKGEKIRVQVAPIIDHNLHIMLVVAYPESDFLHGVTHIQHIIVIISSVTFACSIVIGILVMFMITIPLVKLGKKMDYISMGSFDLIRSDSTKTYLLELRSLEKDFYNMVSALKSFGRFVPVDVVRHLLRNNTEAVAAVSQADLTVMFSDIKGFTQKSEVLSPEQLSLLLSDYLNEMCAVIGDNQGTVDKFIGDAIMALWNVPTPVKNHAHLACETALQSLSALDKLNGKWVQIGLPMIQCRIGIHTGRALVGNLGSKERLAYTAIGDNINLGSRLEALNKKYNTSILISGEVYQQVKSKYLCRYMDVVVVQGRTTPTHLYELVARIDEATAHQVNVCKLHADALNLFYAREFESALDILYNLKQVVSPSDLCVKYLIERATHAMSLGENLPKDWTGYLVLDEK